MLDLIIKGIDEEIKKTRMFVQNQECEIIDDQVIKYSSVLNSTALVCEKHNPNSKNYGSDL